ncbi:MAG TPA: hypothetical protein VG102_01425 [Candidatus Paceibacterota bacterium]|jgi:hypothetical protein|nr:hypothetical protein [Candidatus Paceibacterota bacterium]
MEYAGAINRIVSIVPSEPLLNGTILGSTAQLVTEAVRKAELIRRLCQAEIGIDLVDGYVSVKGWIPDLRRTFETVVVAATAERGVLGLCFADGTVPEDQEGLLGQEVLRIAGGFQNPKRPDADEGIENLAILLASAISSMEFKGTGERWHRVH